MANSSTITKLGVRACVRAHITSFSGLALSAVEVGRLFPQHSESLPGAVTGVCAPWYLRGQHNWHGR